jgi:hypothetical protein
LTGKLLKEEFNRGGAMQHLLLRYTQALLAQPRAYYCARSRWPGGAHLRVLCRRQEGIRSSATGRHWFLMR